jgi:hypothetical protein
LTTSDRLTGSGWLARHVIAIVVFAALALVWSFPLVLHTADALPGADVGDNASFLWNFWWMREAHASGQDFFFTPLLLAPGGVDLTLHTHTALQAWIGATLLGRLPVLQAQNVVILGSLTLNGFCAYLLAFDRVRRWGPALVAGVIFGGAPYISAHLLGHFNLISAWGLPLFTMLWLRATESRRLLPAVAGGLVLGLIAYTDYYYLVYSGAIALCLGVTAWTPIAIRIGASRGKRLRSVLWMLLSLDLALAASIAIAGGVVVDLAHVSISMRRIDNPLTAAWLLLLSIAALTWPPAIERKAGSAPRLLALLKPAAVMAAVAGASMFPLLKRAATLWTNGHYVAPVHQWRSGPAGIDLAALAIPSPMHPLWGNAAATAYRRAGLNSIEALGWLGVVPVVLAAIALWRRGEDPDRRHWMWLGILSFVWALGPWLRVWGFNTGLPLPQGVLSLVPVLSNARMPGRAIVVVMLALAMLSASVLAGLQRRARLRLSVLAIIVVAVDFYPAPFPTVRVAPSSLDFALQQMPPGIVLPIPLGIRDGFGETGHASSQEILAQLTHHHPIVGGFVARVPPALIEDYRRTPTLKTLLELSAAEPDARTEQAAPLTWSDPELDDLGIRYVILDRGTASEPLLAFARAHLPGTPSTTDGKRDLYVLDDRR